MEILLGWKTVFTEVLIVGICYAVYVMITYSTPTRRGFFCDDESIRHPFTGFTIPVPEIYFVWYLPTLALIPITEYIIGRRNVARIYCFSSSVPAWIYFSYKYILGFLFSMALTLLISSISLHFVGRLRPGFISMCQPDLDLNNCSDYQNLYITNYTCTGDKEGERIGRMSFFCGHCSGESCAAFFSILYIYERWSLKGIWNYLSAFISFLFVLLSMLVGITIITDGAHFASDVFVGFGVGIVMAYLIAKYVCGMGLEQYEKASGDEKLNENSPLVPQSSTAQVQGKLIPGEKHVSYL